MKQFLVIGTIVDQSKLTDELLRIHMAYTKEWMDANKIRMSALNADMSGVANIIFANSKEEVEAFYNDEPFYKAGAQVYQITEINIHYWNKD